MNWLPPVLREPILEHLGWTLVHSVWECAVIAMALGIVLLFLRRSETRYLAACAALAACLVASVVTFVMLEPPRSLNLTVQAVGTESNPVYLPDLRVAAGEGMLFQHESAPPSDRSLRFAVPFAGMAWLAGVVLLCARHVMGWMSLRRMRHGARMIIDPAAIDRLHLLKQRFDMRGAIALAETAQVQVPSMIGWLRPVILLPIGALSGLSPLHLEAILAHELAHIRRHDYLANLIQTLIDTLLFYHPAVWWISRQIRQEREHCCDDLAVQVIGDAREYGLALAAMEELRSPAVLAMAASGGSLLKRIRRLAKPEPRRASAVWPVLGMIGVIVLIGACARTRQAQSAQLADPAPATQPSPADAALARDGIPPSTQPILDEQVRGELAEAGQAYSEAQMRRLEAEARFGTNAPETAKARREEDELAIRYQEKLRHLRILREVIQDRPDGQPASPEVLAAIRDAFGYQPSPQEGASQQAQREMLSDRMRRLSQQIVELNISLAQARSQYGPGHAAIARIERETQLVQDLLKSTQAQLKTIDSQMTAAAAARSQDTAAPTPAQVELQLQNDWQHVSLKRQIDLLKTRLDQLTAQDDQGNAKAISILKGNLAEAEEALRKIDAEFKAKWLGSAPAYYISGVPNSGMYPIPDGNSISLVDVINRAGAIQDANMEKFIVIVHQRPVEGQKSLFIRVQDALNRPASEFMRILPGDVIMLTTQGALPLPPEARYTVEGKVAKPGDYPLQKNMTLLQAVVAAGVNPPDAPGWTVGWWKAKDKESLFGAPTTVAMSDLIGGAIGMETISAGDKIKVMAPAEAAPNAK